MDISANLGIKIYKNTEKDTINVFQRNPIDYRKTFWNRI